VQCCHGASDVTAAACRSSSNSSGAGMGRCMQAASQQRGLEVFADVKCGSRSCQASAPGPKPNAAGLVRQPGGATPRGGLRDLAWSWSSLCHCVKYGSSLLCRHILPRELMGAASLQNKCMLQLCIASHRSVSSFSQSGYSKVTEHQPAHCTTCMHSTNFGYGQVYRTHGA
jgi:hypothetical protein